MERILFICVHNSGRSQMAAAFLNQFGQGRFEAESAGFTPTIVNPLVVKVMAEEGIDLSDAKTNDVFDYFREGRLYSHVITVCDDAHEKECPLFPGLVSRAHWPFTDPESLTGSEEKKLAELRTIRDAIRAKVREFIDATR